MEQINSPRIKLFIIVPLINLMTKVSHVHEKHLKNRMTTEKGRPSNKDRIHKYSNWPEVIKKLFLMLLGSNKKEGSSLVVTT